MRSLFFFHAAFSVNGSWGEWGPWGECSRSCGGGEHARTRVCNNPEPANGGRHCEGPFRQGERLCNNHKCPGNNHLILSYSEDCIFMPLCKFDTQSSLQSIPMKLSPYFTGVSLNSFQHRDLT